MDAAMWADVQIRAAIRRGEFDNLPAPVSYCLGGTIRMTSCGGSRSTHGAKAPRPTPCCRLALRKQVEQLPDTVAKLSSK
jgi:hypothetical protein